MFRFDFTYLEDSTQWLIGVDEVGRGPLAGPVMASAVAIHKDWYFENSEKKEWSRVNDSKQLKAETREQLYSQALNSAEFMGDAFQFETGIANVSEIDERNILEATKLAMFRALVSLERRFALVHHKLPRFDSDEMYELAPASDGDVKILVDGRPLKNFPYAHESIVKGDLKSFCVAMASIIAKVERDAWMVDCAEDYPVYDWKSNKGYGTLKHRNALLEHGVTPHHRMSFLRKLMG